MGAARPSPSSPDHQCACRRPCWRGAADLPLHFQLINARQARGTSSCLPKSASNIDNVFFWGTWLEPGCSNNVANEEFEICTRPWRATQQRKRRANIFLFRGDLPHDRISAIRGIRAKCDWPGVPRIPKRYEPTRTLFEGKQHPNEPLVMIRKRACSL